MSRRRNTLVLSAVLLTAPLSTPAQAQDLGGLLGGFGGGLGDVGGDIDSLTTILNMLLDLASLIPGAAVFIEPLKQLLASLQDGMVALGPIIQAVQTIGSYLLKFNEAKTALNGLIHANDYGDSLDALNHLVHVAGLNATPSSLQEFKKDPRVTADKIRSAIMAQKNDFLQHVGPTRSADYADAASAYASSFDELSAQAQRTTENVRATQQAQKSADRAQDTVLGTAKATYDIGMAAVKSKTAVGATKVLVSAAIHGINLQAQTAAVTSEQLADISKQLTVANGQLDVMVRDIQERQRAQAAMVAARIQAAEKNARLNQTLIESGGKSLADGITETMAPKQDAQSDFGRLMLGGGQ